MHCGWLYIYAYPLTTPGCNADTTTPLPTTLRCRAAPIMTCTMQGHKHQHCWVTIYIRFTWLPRPQYRHTCYAWNVCLFHGRWGSSVPVREIWTNRKFYMCMLSLEQEKKLIQINSVHDFCAQYRLLWKYRCIRIFNNAREGREQYSDHH